MAAGTLLPEGPHMAMRRKGKDRTVRLWENVIRGAGMVSEHYEVFAKDLLSQLLADRLAPLGKLMSDDLHYNRRPKDIRVVMREQFGIEWTEEGDEDEDEDQAGPATPPPAKPKPRK